MISIEKSSNLKPFYFNLFQFFYFKFIFFRDIFHPNATTSLEIKVEANLSLHNTLKNIKYYLDVCDCNLVINTQTQSNQNDDVIEDAQVGSPYYLTIFHKIMKRVRFFSF